MKKIEEYKKKNKSILGLKGKEFVNDILWRGVPYVDILKIEKWAIDNKLKEDIREEIEFKKLNRATSNYQYKRIIN